MKTLRFKRVSTGLIAFALALTQVLMPVQSAFALTTDAPTSEAANDTSSVPAVEPEAKTAEKSLNNSFTFPVPKVANVTVVQNVVCGPLNDTLTITKDNATVDEKNWLGDTKFVFAAAKLGYIWNDGSWLPKILKFKDQNTACDKVVQTPVAPSHNDKCGLNNAFWDLIPASTNEVTWSLDATTKHLTVTVKTGFVFSDGTKSKDFGTALDSGVACPTVTPCTPSAGSMVVSKDSQFADLPQDTRSNGHYEFTNNGLKVYTDNNTTNAKVAWYHSVDYSLSQIGDPSMDYQNNFGILPGMQIGLDKDGNGSVDGILVGEPGAYGNNWWSNGNFGIASGLGYASYGTLNDYLAANPGAIVRAVGFSLGSGVYASGILKSITFGCFTWTFKQANKPVSGVKPEAIDYCGRDSDKYIIKSTEGVSYLVDGTERIAGTYSAHTSSVIITAKAQHGYELNGISTWTLHFEDQYCKPKADVALNTFCHPDGQKFMFKVENPTHSKQKYEVVILNQKGKEVFNDKLTIDSYEAEYTSWLAKKDGTYTFKVYSYNDHNRGKKLWTATVETTCATDVFTPEIYKRDQFGTFVEGAKFTIEVCQYNEHHRNKWSCKMYYNVDLGTMGDWFEKNVKYKHYTPTKVTVTETYAPPACTTRGPWTFKWNYDTSSHHDDEVSRNSSNSHAYSKTGSWDNGSNEFNLVNDCIQGQGSIGGGIDGGNGSTTATPAKVASADLPAELPQTGNGGSLTTLFILMAAIVTYGVVYFAQPKKRFDS